MTTPRVAIIVPWRDKGDPYRGANMHTVIDHLTSMRLGDVILTSDGRDGNVPFNRSAAYNLGIALARPDPDIVYIFHEADMLVPHDQLRRAVTWAATTSPGLVVPFDTYRYLSRRDTELVRDGGADPATFSPLRKMLDGRAIGAVNIVTAATMAAVGRWDETFEGWGFDDRAMAHAFEVACGRPAFIVTGDATHLWHEPGWAAGKGFSGGSRTLTAREQRATEANRKRMREYLRTQNADGIRELTAGVKER